MRTFSASPCLRGEALILAVLAATGCGLPRLNAAGEPVGLPEHVTSVKLDPRTMEPMEPMEKKPVEKKSVEEPKAKTAPRGKAPK